MRKRSTLKKPQELGGILQKILAKQNIHFHRENRHLNELWSKAVGPQIAVQTHPDRLQKDILHVKVANSVWMHQLQYVKQDIIDKFNKVSGKDITQIFFFLDNTSLRKDQHIDRSHFDYTTYPLKTRDKKLIEKSTENIVDQELKELLKRTMTKEIIRRRIMEK